MSIDVIKDILDSKDNVGLNTNGAVAVDAGNVSGVTLGGLSRLGRGRLEAVGGLVGGWPPQDLDGDGLLGLQEGLDGLVMRRLGDVFTVDLKGKRKIVEVSFTQDVHLRVALHKAKICRFNKLL